MSHSTLIKSVPIKSLSALRQAVQALNARGIVCTLVQDAEPRMYYQQQLKMHFGRDSEKADYVLQVRDSYYDLAFLKNELGHYDPVFDDYDHPSYQVPATNSGKGPLRNYLGNTCEESRNHWNGLAKQESEQQLLSIGGLLQEYTMAAAMEQVNADGYMVDSVTRTKTGEIQILIDIPD